MTWIQTYTGKKFDILNPTSDMIDFEDICHVLAHRPRYNAHTPRFYSLAEHSIIVAMNVAPRYRLEALLHDAAETYLPDLPSPIKGKFPLFIEMENNILDIIYKKAGILDRCHDGSIHDTDHMIVVNEQRALFPTMAEPWKHEIHNIPPVTFFPLSFMEQDVAYQEFKRVLTHLGCKEVSDENL